MPKYVSTYLLDYLLVLCMYLHMCMHVSVLRFSSRMYCLFEERMYVRTYMRTREGSMARSVPQYTYALYVLYL